jgi:hypothetical protein
MTLKEALIGYGQANLTEANDWYDWKLNPKYVPAGIELPVGNPFTQNVSLKIQLCRIYSSADDQLKKAITRYYIADWGGIRTNREEIIQSYSSDTPESLIGRGTQGIPSWSKALCIRDPDRYAIYDARVAVSLNCLQISHAVDRPIAFPMLFGQNKLINRRSTKVREYATMRGWPTLENKDFYEEYNNLLSIAAKPLNVKLYTLEMLLFAKAPALLQRAFPNENFEKRLRN